MTIKVRRGSSFVDGAVKVRRGGAWVSPSGVFVRRSGAWARADALPALTAGILFNGPNPFIVSSASGDTYNSIGQSVVGNGNGGSGNYTYAWSATGGGGKLSLGAQPIPNARGIAWTGYVVGSNNTITVTVTVHDTGTGETATASMSVAVKWTP